MRKRAAAILLALCMALTLLPTAAFATEEGGAAAPVEQPAQQEEKQEEETPEQPEGTPQQPEEQPEAKPAEQPEQQQESVAQGEPAVQSADQGIALLADEHKHCICGGSVTAGDHTSHSDVTYQPWNGTSSITYTNNVAYVYLTGNATINNLVVSPGKTLYLCLGGKTYKSNGTSKINVGDSSKNDKTAGHLILCDCQGGGTVKGATSGWGGMCVYLYNSRLDMFGGKLTGGKVTKGGGGGAIALDDRNCTFNMYGGEISGNDGRNYGGAVFQNFAANKPNATGGNFNMYGGVIKNNSAKNGGAFFSTTGGTINMTGGTISGNKATQSDNNAGGGAIYMRGNGTINISGNAQITGNSSSLDGGAILMGWGAINISGSVKINNNTASRWGGAICLRQDSNQSTTLNMRGGEISGNRATKEGGAVHVLDKQCQFYLYDGKITGNTSGDGGAIYLNQEPSWLIMQGGEISGNTATGNGGGVYIYRTGSVCQLYSGKIENNKASGNGGGIYINPSNSGQLRVGNKPLVQNNTASGKANNVYLPSGKTLTIEIGMSKGASIGVTTANTSYPVAFSNDYKNNYANYFFADDANAHVEYNKDDQKLYLISGAVARPLTVTFDPNGGTLADADRTRPLMTGETYGPLPVPNYEGYDFAGWYTEQNGGTKIESDTTVTVFGTQTLYAHWTEHEYTVTVVKIGKSEWGSVTPMSTKAKAGETVTLTATPTTGNQFLEWVFLNKPEGGGWVNPVLTFTMPAEDLTIQAKFTVKNYTISYTLEGVSGGSARIVVWGDKVFKYLPQNPTYRDWVFTGWKCGDVTVTEDMTYGDLAGNDTVSSIHIIAQWHQHEFNTWTNGYPGTLKTPADCTHDAVYYWRCVCGEIEYNDNHLYEEPGTALGHLWSWTSNGNGTHTRTCRRENCNATETDNCSGGTATCTAKAKCSTCNAEYGEKLPHDFTAETAEEQYLKSGSSCTEKAVYYKSCTVCGLSSKGTASEATFESGSVLGHEWGAWTSNGNVTHTRVCSRDASHTETESCSGGEATCTAKAKCSTCNAEYGETNPNNHAGTLGEWQSDGNNHWKEYSCCGAEADRGPHDWDNGQVTTQPTCTNAGEKTFTCNECGRKKTEQIDATGHSWKQEWNSDETHHWHECANGCDAKDAYAEHADNDKNHVCDTCGKVLSECADDNKDHKCDYCGKVLSVCADDNKDHKCDYCGKTLSECADDNKDHKCDYCGKVLSVCADDNKDHKCDYCGKTISNHTGGTADCCHKAVCEICGKAYGGLDPDNHTDLKHFPAQRATILREGNIEYWYCSGCGKYYKDAKATIEITQEDTVIPKVKRDNSGIPSHGGETGKTDKNDKTVQSVKTGDAGVALYGAMALLSLTGGAWIVGKKRRS